MNTLEIRDFEVLVENIKSCLLNFGIFKIEHVRKNKSSFLKMLTDGEIKLYERYLREKSRLEFLGGRVLLKQCLLRSINKDACRSVAFKDIDIKRGENGKPRLFIRDNEIDSVYFSISHKMDYIFCAVDYDSNIGIDVEKVDKKLIRLKSYYMTSKEEKIISGTIKVKDLLPAYYTMLWASKECLVKCLGQNLWQVLGNSELVEIRGKEYVLRYRRKDREIKVISNNFLYDGYVFSVIHGSEEKKKLVLR